MKKLLLICLIILSVKAYDSTQCQLCKDVITTNIGTECYNKNYTETLFCSNIYSTTVVNFDICVAKNKCFTPEKGYDSKCVCTHCRDKDIIKSNDPYEKHWDCTLSKTCGGDPDTDECYASIIQMSPLLFILALIILLF